ncbi:MAG: J domain-containing protein [Alphaproteobacteria bacterium]|nr:J domain-containing protein [Alphaproteobacteria bacterium]
MKRKCDHPNCEKTGEYKAPKDRSLKEYYWFCLNHVREYNKNWNFYAGMSDAEFQKEEEAERLGKRPIWQHARRLTPEDIQNIDDPIALLGRHVIKKTPFKAGSNEEKALAVFEIKWPFSEKELKSKYKEWVKRVHPDMTGGETEEKFKEISEAFSILKKTL